MGTDNDKTLAESWSDVATAASKLNAEIWRSVLGQHKGEVPGIRQHVIVVGSLLVLIGVMIWLNYFGPLS